MNRPFAFSLLIGFAIISGDTRAEETPWIIKGQVVDEKGKPASEFEVARFWSANGQQWNDDGTFPKLDTPEAISKFWDDEGKVATNPNLQGKISAEGRFEVVGSNTGHAVVVAFNKSRTRGGLAYVAQDDSAPVAITLNELVRVRGEIRFDGKVPEWTYAAVFLPKAVEGPL